MSLRTRSWPTHCCPRKAGGFRPHAAATPCLPALVRRTRWPIHEAHSRSDPTYTGCLWVLHRRERRLLTARSWYSSTGRDIPSALGRFCRIGHALEAAGRRIGAMSDVNLERSSAEVIDDTDQSI